MQESTYVTNLKKTVDMFRRNDRLHRRLFERRAVEAFGIHRSQHIMLMFISKHEDASQRQIADNFEISAAAVTVTLKKLETAGFIVRITDEGDSRLNHIRLTEKGKSVIADTHELFSSIDYAMFDGLSESELTVLSRCLEKMNNNLREAAENTPERPKGRNE